MFACIIYVILPIIIIYKPIEKMIKVCVINTYSILVYIRCININKVIFLLNVYGIYICNTTFFAIFEN